MTARKLKLKVSKQFKNSQEKIKKIGVDAGEGVERNFLRRFTHLTSVRRFIGVWLALIILLLGIVIAQIFDLRNYYQQLEPQPGGQYTEGILGDFTNANPIYATNPVDTAVAKLVFSGLVRYNTHNQLVGDLASDWSVNDIGTVYTFHLKPHLTWQDGKSLTAQDVLFTFQVIQNADAQSPYQSSWEGITVAAPDARTVTFTLPNPLSSFPYSLTTGIIPQHLLGSVPMTEMRAIDFNTLHPVGSGPFSFQAIEAHGDTPESKSETIELLPFSHYAEGQPKLDEFVVRAFHDQNRLIASFRDKNLNGIAGLSDIPKDFVHDGSIQRFNFPLTAEEMIFFRNTANLLNDTSVRQALVKGTNVPAIIGGLGYPTEPVREPLLINQLGFDPAYMQSGFNFIAAEQELTSDGWLPGPGGVRYKNGVPLEFTLTAADTPEYNYVAKKVQQQWRTLGVNLQLSLQDDTDLQNTVNSHSYDALLYGISIGVDPDVFVYWDSTQFDPRLATRLNLSEYKNSNVDEALEEGRTRTDPNLRIIKYRPFLQDWQQDAPALGLYQPRFLYLTRGPVFGLSEQDINTGIERYDNVQNWEIREVRQTDN